MFNKESGEIANLKRALLECKRKHEIGARLSNAAVKRSYHVCESFALSPSVARNLEARVGIEPKLGIENTQDAGFTRVRKTTKSRK